MLIQIYRYPNRDSWAEILRRPVADTAEIETAVRSIIDDVRATGDRALRRYTHEFDRTAIADFVVGAEEIRSAIERVPSELKRAIELARDNVEKFHAAQVEEIRYVETMPGVTCWRRSTPIERVGLYIPGGTAPLFSTVLMLAVPAKLAGCAEMVLCSPPNRDGMIDDAILFAADLCGVDRIFKIGGAQAIAALAYGTESIPRVDKIFGPGNSYVTCAKQIVSRDVAIDMPAGPSEVAVIADESCDPRFVAADLLSQAEHGRDSQVVLIATDGSIIDRCLAEVDRQIETLPRREIALDALRNSIGIVTKDLDTAIRISNEYAPEHLILATTDPRELAEKVVNAGSVFLGHFSSESAGDYASGTNHTLPTAGWARSMSGVSLDSFLKKITFQQLTEEGVRNLASTVEMMASGEGLEAHRRAMSIRREEIDGF